MNNKKYGFETTFQSKLIYVMRINDERHKNILKIGEASAYITNEEELMPNSKTLNEAAKKRINDYTRTAGTLYELIWTELAVTDEGEVFRDYQIHNVLKNSGIKKVDLETGADEWYQTDLETVKNAISCYKEGKNVLTGVQISPTRNPIIFRPEQKEAIEKTVKHYSSNKSKTMLWNAKMRFGKTLCALEVVKRKQYKKTIIITHRPVVKEGWSEDFEKIFGDTDNYIYGEKDKASIEKLEKSNLNYVYFASIQDLRGSEKVGGKFDKNNNLFKIDWDFIVVDEAHEGTLTQLGKNVMQALLEGNENTHVLQLSGTPFNLLSMFEESEIYTWDYIMEQQAKQNLAKNNYLDSNPYEDLPKLNIYTYNLDKFIPNYQDIEDKAFNFREFFRVWTGDIDIDKTYIPKTSSKGSFVHEKDVLMFLNLLTKKDENNNYPFSNDVYRDYFRHTFWTVPGVKEARALSKLMKSHPVFGSGDFEILNVAGEGDEDADEDNALELVKKAIGDKPEEKRTITISCGRLTTGVTIPAWTGVFMLSGSYSTSASSYLQTIFRVQTPATIGGKYKTNCYVFDFAPDRTLKMVAEAGELTKNSTSGNQTTVMGDFLNFCPVIAVEGSDMKPYNVDNMLIQLKKAYINKVIKSGFDHQKIYNNELLKLSAIELAEFKELKGIIGDSNQTKQTDKVQINKQGYTEEEYEEIEKIKKKKTKELTPEEAARLAELKEKQKQRKNAISILRGISIRIPLLVYGADIPVDYNITVENFTDIIDDISWKEFMPKGVTKELFNKFTKYYDKEIFVEAAKRIRKRSLDADSLPIIERINRIADIFSTFKNPDKETVLTPWRIVNMHLGDCIGGYNFYDKNYQEVLNEPRYIMKSIVTNDIFKPDSVILEINSKTGLYPLYAAYSIYRSKLLNYNKHIKDIDEKENIAERLWKQTLEDHIYILCKTPMAVSITKRTLAGYNDYKVNAQYYENLIKEVKVNENKVKEDLEEYKFWEKDGERGKKIMFDAIVGNPPYQENDNGTRDEDAGANASASPLYDQFTILSQKLTNQYVSLIMPSRWMAGGKGLDKFREHMLNDNRFRVLHDYVDERQVFDNVSIKGGICYFLWDKMYEGDSDIFIHETTKTIEQRRKLSMGNTGVFVRYLELINIKEKVWDVQGKKNKIKSIDNIISTRKPYELRTDALSKPKKYGISKIYDIKNEMLKEGIKEGNILEVFGLIKTKRVLKYIRRDEIVKGLDSIDKYKVFIPYAYGCGAIGEEIPSPILGSPILGSPIQVCTETFLRYGIFDTKQEAENALKYLKTKFFRSLVGIYKITQHSTNKTYRLVPIQDFTENSDIDWSKTISEIDQQLYRKYNLDEEEIDFIETYIKEMK